MLFFQLQGHREFSHLELNKRQAKQTNIYKEPYAMIQCKMLLFILYIECVLIISNPFSYNGVILDYEECQYCT